MDELTQVDPKLQKIAVSILDEIAGGADELSVCNKFSITRGTFVRWMIQYPTFESAVVEAKRQRADSYRSIIQQRMYDEKGNFLSLHKDSVPGEKLIFEKLKWLAEMDNPDKYGAKVKHEGPVGGNVQILVDTGVKSPDSIPTKVVEVKQEIKEDYTSMDF